MEYVSSLGIGDYRFIQNTEGYAFTQDSVFLVNLAKLGSKDRVLDLGAGHGIISVLAVIKRGVASAVGIELDADAAALAFRNVELNELGGRIAIINGDVRDVRTLVKGGSFDKALCNPPYYTEPSADAFKHEGDAVLDDFIAAAGFALKNGGELSLVIKAARLTDALCSMRARRLEPKRATFVYPKAGADADTVIIAAKKGGRPGLRAGSLTVLGPDGRLTPEAAALYTETAGENYGR